MEDDGGNWWSAITIHANQHAISGAITRGNGPDRGLTCNQHAISMQSAMQSPVVIAPIEVSRVG